MKFSIFPTLSAKRFAGIVLTAGMAVQAVEAQQDSGNVVFGDDFGRGSISEGPSPLWQWNTNPSDQLGMMIGKDDIYDVVEGEQFISHRKSLRLNFSGRNGFCNICGGEDVTVKSVSGNTACVSSPTGPFEDYVYNKSNAFSTWRVTSSSDNGGEVCFDVSQPISQGVSNTDPEVKVGDIVHLPFICGVNGVIGGNEGRRSDCNKAINYLDGSENYDVGYGESISRRFYLYIPKETTLPNLVLKLGYSYWQRPGASQRSSVITISVQRDMTMGLVLPDGQNIVYAAREQDAPRPVFDTWMYFEEVFTRETSEGASDATYKLFMGPAGSDTSNPVVDETGMVFGELKKMSIGGNWQHTNDVSGYVYFDNIKISDKFIGPVARPSAPE